MRQGLLQTARQSIRRFGTSWSRNARPHLNHRRLVCEQLEDRQLLSIGGYPELPGLHLVDPRPDQFDDQIIYLDFDGEEDVTYNGPVVVEDIDIPAFEAPGELAGQEQEIIASVVSKLEETFAGTGIIFTTTEPVAGVDHSTIHIGGDDLLFAEHGSFLGLAEHVDAGNLDGNDRALVFSESFKYPTATCDQHTRLLQEVIVHETGRLLGYANLPANSNIGPLDHVAASGSKSGSKSTNAEYTQPYTWVSTGITISGAPINAQISSIKVEWDVDSNYISDIKWVLERTDPYWGASVYSDMTSTGNDGWDGYSQTSDQSKTITGVPSSVPVNGTWWFNIKDDFDDSNNDWDKGRIDWWKITVNYTYTPPKPDLEVTSMEIDDGTASGQHFDTGESVRLDFRGHNDGEATSKRSIRMKWWYGTSAYAKTNEISYGYLGTINGLSPNEYEWETDASWSVPTTPGTYWLTVKIDDNNQQSDEKDESNNERTLRFIVDPPPKPDLDVLSVTGTEPSYYIGDKLWAEATVKNVGNATAEESTLDWYLGTTSNHKYRLIEDNAWLGEWDPIWDPDNNLSPNEQDTDEINWGGWTIPEDIPAGTYYVYAFAKTQTDEPNTSNNEGHTASFEIKERTEIISAYWWEENT